MPKILASSARHPRNTTHQHFSGWALERAAALDQRGDRGLLADITTAPILKRQTAFAMLATYRPDEIYPFLERLGGQQHLGDALRSRTARDLLQTAFGTPIPMGYLRALVRIGRDPLGKPNLYRRLFEIYTNPAEDRRAHVLRYCGTLSASRIEAVDVLDPALLDPEIVSCLLGTGSSYQLNSLFRFIRLICSSATDQEIAKSFREGAERWHHVAQRWLERADRFPESPYQVSGLTPLTSAKEMASLGKSMRNCLRSKVGDVLLGLAYFYRADTEIAGADLTPVVVELTPISNGTWLVAGVHGPRHQSLPPHVVHQILKPLLDQGALVCAAPQRDAEKLASTLGIRRWDEYRLPNVGDAGEEQFGGLLAGGDWAPA